MATPSPDVLIVGAGIGGLTAALAMQQRGLRVVISEQARQLSEVGAGLTLTPNLTRVLHHLGLEDALSAIMLVPEVQLIRHWQSGETLVQKQRGQVAIDTYGFPYGHVHRADIHTMLAQAVLKHDADAILLGKAAVSALSHGPSATVMYGDGTHLTAGVVVGADGVRSRVRDSLFKTTPARFTGHVAWRAIVPTAQMAEAAVTAPPGLFLGPGRMFMRYPIRGGSAWNYAAFARQSGWTTDSWTARADASDPLAMFEGWHDVVTQTLRASPPDGVYKWALYARDPLETWVEGRVTLLGDAAHAMLPFLGQGAAMSVEDGLVLARCLHDITDTDAALARYQTLRKGRCDDTQIEASAIADRLQAQEAGDYAKGPVRDEESMGYYRYDAVGVVV
jgi:salicylate hydroxylase